MHPSHISSQTEFLINIYLSSGTLNTKDFIGFFVKKHEHIIFSSLKTNFTIKLFHKSFEVSYFKSFGLYQWLWDIIGGTEVYSSCNRPRKYNHSGYSFLTEACVWTPASVYLNNFNINFSLTSVERKNKSKTPGASCFSSNLLLDFSSPMADIK